MDIVIEGERVKSERVLHKLLAEKLYFGPYYGRNLAALRDRLEADVERPVRLVWKNSSQSEAAMGQDLFGRIIALLRAVETRDREFGLQERFTFVLE